MSHPTRVRSVTARSPTTTWTAFSITERQSSTTHPRPRLRVGAGTGEGRRGFKGRRAREIRGVHTGYRVTCGAPVAGVPAIISSGGGTNPGCCPESSLSSEMPSCFFGPPSLCLRSGGGTRPLFSEPPHSCGILNKTNNPKTEHGSTIQRRRKTQADDDECKTRNEHSQNYK